MKLNFKIKPYCFLEIVKKGMAISMKNIDNIYTLDGKVPLAKALPFGFQHILTMFAANITPIIF